MTATDDVTATRAKPSRAPGLMFGIGLGGFVDGIVLHQLLQWHHMASATDEHPPTDLEGLEFNTMADGYFHAVTWFVVLGASIVTVALWRQGRLAPSWSFHAGGVIAGWGLFNVAEGLVNHQVLRIHHVRDDLGGPLSWDLGFLVVGVLMVLAGAWLQSRGEARSRPARRG
jgi:uncharacterized membrane protein